MESTSRRKASMVELKKKEKKKNLKDWTDCSIFGLSIALRIFSFKSERERERELRSQNFITQGLRF